MVALATDMGPALAGFAMEMVAVVAVPVVARIRIIEKAVIAPVAVIERAIEAVVIAVIIIRAADANAHRDTIAMAIIGTARNQDGGQRRAKHQYFGFHLSRLQLSGHAASPT